MRDANQYIVATIKQGTHLAGIYAFNRLEAWLSRM